MAQPAPHESRNFRPGRGTWRSAHTLVERAGQSGTPTPNSAMIAASSDAHVHPCLKQKNRGRPAQGSASRTKRSAGKVQPISLLRRQRHFRDPAAREPSASQPEPASICHNSVRFTPAGPSEDHIGQPVGHPRNVPENRRPSAQHPSRMSGPSSGSAIHRSDYGRRQAVQ